MGQVPVPQKDEGESCGYRMLSNLIKIIKGQEIQRERDKERNRLYYYLEIAKPLKDNQIKRNQKRKQEREEKRRRRRGRRRRTKRNRRRRTTTTPKKKQKR